MVGAIPGVRTSVSGNQALVAALLNRCRSSGIGTVHTSTVIAEVVGSPAEGYHLVDGSGNKSADRYDAVVVATSLERSAAPIAFGFPNGSKVEPPAPRPFAETYATVVRGKLDPAYFGGPGVVGQDEINMVTSDSSDAPFNLVSACPRRDPFFRIPAPAWLGRRARPCHPMSSHLTVTDGGFPFPPSPPSRDGKQSRCHTVLVLLLICRG